MIEAERILSSADPISELQSHLDNLVAGEDDNKQLIFMLLQGSVADDPKLKQMIMLKGDSGAGKSRLMRLANAFIVFDVARFSSKALDYAKLEEYDVLRQTELGFSDEDRESTSSLKFLSTDDGGYRISVTAPDGDGSFTTLEKTIKPITFISSTIRSDIDPQLDRRVWSINPDESDDQTERVHQFSAKQADDNNKVTLGIIPYTNYDFSTRTLTKIVQKIKESNVTPMILFNESLGKVFSKKPLRSRGDWYKIENLIKLGSLMMQKQLPHVTIAIPNKNNENENDSNRKKIILVTPQVAVKVLKISINVISSMMTKVEKREIDLISALEERGIVEENDEITKSDRDILSRKLGKSPKTILRHLNNLDSKGIVSRERGRKGKGSQTSHILLKGIKEIKQDITTSIDPDRLSNQVKRQMMEEFTRKCKELNIEIDPKYLNLEVERETDHSESTQESLDLDQSTPNLTPIVGLTREPDVQITIPKSTLSQNKVES